MPSCLPFPLLAFAAPGGENAWVYYVVCALFFVLCGLACGYFIWRKGNMQMQDAELEVKRTAEELQALQDDLREEERGIRLESESSEVEKNVP